MLFLNNAHLVTHRCCRDEFEIRVFPDCIFPKHQACMVHLQYKYRDAGVIMKI